MANSRRFGRQRTGGRRRSVGWEAGVSNAPETLVSAGATQWATGRIALADGLIGVRIRGEFCAWLSLVTAIGDGFSRLAVGICVVTENAFNAGVASIPDPLADMGWDGWWFHSLHGPMAGHSTTEDFMGPMGAIRVPIDTKSMRKLRITDTICGVVSLGTEVGTAGLDFGAQTRILIKSPS